MHSGRSIKLMLLLASCVFVVSCSTVSSKVGKTLNLDTDLTLELKVDSDINPDDNNTPSPLFVRLYELKSDVMFSRANFIDLYERDKETLGADLVDKQRLKRIKPGEDAVISLVLKNDTRYVGLLGEFSQFKTAGYKVLIPVVTNNVIATHVDIKIAGNTISIIKN